MTGLGWYWDPWLGAYTFVPAGGVFYGPFGWGFYSPIAVYRSPFFFYPAILTGLENTILHMDTDSGLRQGAPLSVDEPVLAGGMSEIPPVRRA